MAEVSARFSATRDAPRTARHFMTDALVGWGYGESLMQDAQLVVAELASNAVVHARSSFSVAACAEPFGVRISVHDASSVTPTVRENDPIAPSGRGLHRLGRQTGARRRGPRTVDAAHAVAAQGHGGLGSDQVIEDQELNEGQ
jgi:hypothetical protein